MTANTDNHQSCPAQSVIIPTYNRKDILAEAINSVLSQSLKDLEVLVVDDCSTDGTEDFVKSIPDERVHYIRNDKNSGQEYSRMMGLRHARGKYITFLDDDDYYTDYDFFAKAINIFTEHENDAVPIVMVYANAELVDITTHETFLSDIGTSGRVRGLDFMLGRGHSKPPSTFPAVFRAEALRQAGLEDNVIFDKETYCQAALLGDLWCLDCIIGVYRLLKHSSSLGYRNHPVHNKRIDAKVKAMAERAVLIAEGILHRADKKTADEWLMNNAKLLINCYRGQQNYINELKTYGRAMLIMSGFTRKVLVMTPFWEVRSLLSRITTLHKLYRFINYKLRGKPYHVV